jgi:hypothetical protein
MRVDESMPEQQGASSSSMGSAGASANGGQAFTGKAYHAANAPQELAVPDAGVGAGETEPTADAGDSDAARPSWIVNSNDAGTPSSSGAAGMTAAGTGGAAGGTGGITGGSGGSGSDPSTGGTGGSSSSGTGGTGGASSGTGGMTATGGSGGGTPSVRCKVSSGNPLAGQTIGCDAASQQLFAGVDVSWTNGGSTYFCAATNATPCAHGAACTVYYNSTMQSGVCQ